MCFAFFFFVLLLCEKKNHPNRQDCIIFHISIEISADGPTNFTPETIFLKFLSNDVSYSKMIWEKPDKRKC